MLRPVFPSPGGKEHVEIGRCGSVGIAIGMDGETALPSFFNVLENSGKLCPVLLPIGFEMRNLKRNSRLPGHVKRLRIQGVGLDLVLDTDALPEANMRLMQSYEIPSLRYQAP